MTFLGENIWEIKMVIQDHYDVPHGVKIIKLGLLLKNGNGSAQTEDFIVEHQLQLKSYFTRAGNRCALL